jgi:hypothetical protein
MDQPILASTDEIFLVIDDIPANAFLDYQDDLGSDNSESLHYLFVKASGEVQRVKEGMSSKPEAQSSVDAFVLSGASRIRPVVTHAGASGVTAVRY